MNSNKECSNNPTGRAFTENPCGNWNETNNQFNTGHIINNTNVIGALFPNNTDSTDIMVPPNDRVIFGNARIGETYRSR